MQLNASTDKKIEGIFQHTHKHTHTNTHTHTRTDLPSFINLLTHSYVCTSMYTHWAHRHTNTPTPTDKAHAQTRARTRCDRVSMYLSRGPLFSRSHGPRDVQKCPPHAQASTSSHPSSNPCNPRQSDPTPHGHTYIHPNTPSCTRKAEGRARGATAVPSWRPTDTLQKDKRDQTREN